MSSSTFWSSVLAFYAFSETSPPHPPPPHRRNVRQKCQTRVEVGCKRLRRNQGAIYLEERFSSSIVNQDFFYPQ